MEVSSRVIILQQNSIKVEVSVILFLKITSSDVSDDESVHAH